MSDPSRAHVTLFHALRFQELIAEAKAELAEVEADIRLVDVDQVKVQLNNLEACADHFVQTTRTYIR
jgi:tetrahydromethanopterin S-methyltransferase subunit B